MKEWRGEEMVWDVSTAKNRTEGEPTIFLASVSKETLQKVNTERRKETGVDWGQGGMCV